jgi:hypothetical protein
LPPPGLAVRMRQVRQLGLTLALLCLLASGCGSAGTARAHHAATPAAKTSTCTAFGKSWAHKYNAAGGPIKIVTACCAHRSLQTGNSACEVMVTVRKGPGEGTFGCSVATVTADGDIIANKPQACAREAGALPA